MNVLQTTACVRCHRVSGVMSSAQSDGENQDRTAEDSVNRLLLYMVSEAASLPTKAFNSPDYDTFHSSLIGRK